MKKIFFVFTAIFITLSSSTVSFAEMLLFWDKDCSYCKELNEFLSENNYSEKFQIQSYEVRENKLNEAYYLQKAKELNYTDLLFPFLVHDKEYFDGKDEIVAHLTELDSQVELSKTTQEQESYLSKDESRLLTSMIKDEAKEVKVENTTEPKSVPNAAYDRNTLIYIGIFSAIVLSLGTFFFWKRRNQ